jgi:hypothetical protein
VASRNLTVDNTEITTEDVLSCMFDNAATEDSPVTLTALAVELGVSNADIRTALENVDESFVEGDPKGNLLLTGDYTSEEEMLADYAKMHTSKLPESPKAVTPAVVVTESEVIEPVNQSGWENPSHESHMIPFTAGDEIHPGFTRMPDPKPEQVNACPPGVNPNFWELAWYSPTLAGKRHWTAQCIAQQKAYTESQEAAPVEPEAKGEYEYATDENGMPVL